MSNRKARMCAARKMKSCIQEGKERRQAAAIAFSECKKESYRLPKIKKVS